MKFGDLLSNVDLPATEFLIVNSAPGWSYPNGGGGVGALTTVQMPWTGMVLAEVRMCWRWSGYQHLWNWFVAGTQTPDLAPQSQSLFQWGDGVSVDAHVNHTVFGVWNSVAGGTNFTVSIYTTVGGGGPSVVLDSFSLNVRMVRA